MYYRLKVGYILDVVFEECVKNYATDHRLRIIDKIMRGVCGLDIWIKLMDTLTYLSWLVDLFHKRLKLNYSKYFTLNILLRYMQYSIKKWFLLNIEIGTYSIFLLQSLRIEKKLLSRSPYTYVCITKFKVSLVAYNKRHRG